MSLRVSHGQIKPPFFGVSLSQILQLFLLHYREGLPLQKVGRLLIPTLQQGQRVNEICASLWGHLLTGTPDEDARYPEGLGVVVQEMDTFNG